MGKRFQFFLCVIFTYCSSCFFASSQTIPETKSNLNEQLVLKSDSVIMLQGFPVTGLMKDTLFFVYEKMGSFKPKERAELISKKIQTIADNEFLKIDSITNEVAPDYIDIIYGETILMSVSEQDAKINNSSIKDLASEYTSIIKAELEKMNKERSLSRLLKRIGLLLLVLIGTWLLYYLVLRGFRFLNVFAHGKRDVWLKDLSYKKYTFITIEQEFTVILFFIRVLKWFIFLLLLYFALPLVFSIFPFTRGWANVLLNLIWSPFKSILLSIWNYLPNLFIILVIVLVMRYFVRFVKYVFSEIKSGRLKLPGFYPEWAMPTFGIVRFLLLAFMFVLIFPFLPESDSDIFKGVSVFLGVLISLGSSSAIANMIAGLVITYMRPFQIGDRVKIGGITGDVVEKTLLVTRLITIKNEVITIPNSSILTGNTINYSSVAKKEGLIIYTTVTIGYDVPWRNMHEALIEAAERTELLVNDPKPYVLQTSLDDFYVSYQINAVTKVPKKQAVIYSNLHQNIQDVCNERGIEIMSPHYRSQRDGNKTTISEEYISKGRKSTGFSKDES